MLERPPSGSIPDAPGSYQFLDPAGRVIYVGKARSLRQRLANYFQSPANMPVRTAQMVAAAATVEWIQVTNEVEALMLEYSLIKQHRPRFNVRLVDDKSYPYLAVTLSDEWPRPMVIRGRRRKGTRYFGPYAHAYAIRETLDELLRTFPLRTCSDTKFRRHERQGRPCLLFHIEKCCGPCVGAVDPPEYDRLVTDLIGFLEGDTEPVVRALNDQMAAASAALDFETAARVRDRLAAVQRAVERQQMVGGRDEDVDVIGVAEDALEASAQVFFVRRGRVVGRLGFVLDKVMDLDPSQTIAAVVEQIYGEEPAVGYPREVLVPVMPEDSELYEEYLSAARGSRVRLRVPRRGSKRQLASTVERNAADAFTRHRLRRGSDHNSRARALNELQEALGLPDAPLRIECYDMSHLQGTDYVGSLVVLEDGLPRPTEYRRFKLRGIEGNDDFAAMEEVLRRRFTNYLEETARPASERGRFAYPPQLLLVDGGRGQLSVAVRVLAELGLTEQIPVAALAKEFEQVFVPGRSTPVDVRRGSEALFLLQRIRDESHRFAVSYHRQLRGRRMTESVLDGVPGLGPRRRQRLLEEFGGLRRLRRTDLEELRGASWLPDDVAVAVHGALHPSDPGGGDD